MDSSPQDQEASHTCEQNIRVQFAPTLQGLQSALEQLESFAAVLLGNNSLARHFDLPLASDTKAAKIDSLFDTLELVEDDDGEVDSGICWLDVVLEPTYQPTLGEDGYYYLQLNGRKGQIKLSESDHKLIESRIPSRLVNPLSYPGDVRAEKKAMRIVEDLLLTLNEVASQVIKTNNGCQARISERFTALRQLSSPSQNQWPINDNSSGADPQPDAQCEVTGPSRTATQERTKKRKAPSNLLWNDEELDRLPEWFQKNKDLRTDKIKLEAQFKKDFHVFRTASAIVAASYRVKTRKPKGTRVKRKRPEDDVSPQSTAIAPASMETTSIGPLSQAFASTPGSAVSFLTARRPASQLDGSSDSATQSPPGKSQYTPYPEAVIQEDAEDGAAWNENPICGAPRAEVTDQPGIIIHQPAAEETVMDSGSLVSDSEPVQFCSSDAREGINPGAIDGELQNIARFQPVNPPVSQQYQEKRSQEKTPATNESVLKGRRSRTDCITCRRAKAKCDRQRPSCNSCIQGNLACEGYNRRRKPITSEISSAWQYPQETALPPANQNNPLKDAVNPNTAINHCEQSGQQPNISAANPRSNSMSLSRAWPNSQVVLGQVASRYGVITASELPPLNNPRPGRQIIPPINRILDDQHAIPSHIGFRGWHQ